MAISDLQPVDYGAYLNQSQAPLPGQVGQAQFQQDQTRQLQLAAVQRQAQQQQALAAARQQAISNPTTQNLSALQILDPDHSEAIKSAHDALTKDQQTQQLREVAAVQGYLGAGRPQDAAAIVQRRIDADKAAGVDTSDDEQMLNLINTNPDQAKGVVANHLFSVLGPDKYTAAFQAAGEDARANAEQPGKLAKTAADTALAEAQTAKATAEAGQVGKPTPQNTEYKVVKDAYGNEQVVAVGPNVDGGAAPTAAQPLPGPVGQQITAAASAAGANDAEQSYLNATARIESGGNPNAKNGASTGVFGFHADTFKGAGGSDITNTAQQTTAALNLARQNAQQLGQVLGQPPTPQQVYLAHQQGAGGAAALLTADPNTPAIAALQAAGVPPKIAQLSITGNGGTADMTAGQFVNMISGKYDKAAGAGQPASGSGPGAKVVYSNAGQTEGSGSDPIVTGDDFLKTLPPSRARYIQAIANGDAAMPTGRNAASPQGQLLMDQVLQYDPTASAINLPARQATRKDFTSGKAAQNVTALNTAIGHLGSLDTSIAELRNTNFPAINKIGQAIGGQVDTTTQKALADFRAKRKAVADEVTRVFRGTGGAESDVQATLKNFDEANGPEALHSAVKATADLLSSRLEGLRSQYKQGMALTSDDFEIPNFHAKQALDKLAGNRPDATAAQPAATASAPPPAPKPGQVVQGYRFKGGNPADRNSWVPQ